METMNDHAENLYAQAMGYMKTLERSLITKSRFSDDLLYGIAAISYEKFMVAFLAAHGKNAMHHTPFALFQEASECAGLPEEVKTTAALLTRFESICSLDGFGYKTPTKEELEKMIRGLIVVKNFVGGTVVPVAAQNREQNSSYSVSAA